MLSKTDTLGYDSIKRTTAITLLQYIDYIGLATQLRELFITNV